MLHCSILVTSHIESQSANGTYGQLSGREQLSTRAVTLVHLRAVMFATCVSLLVAAVCRFKIFGPIFCVSAVALFPIYYTANGLSATGLAYSSVETISVSNIPDNSNT